MTAHTPTYTHFSSIIKGRMDIEEASNRHARIKSRIIMVLFRMDAPADFLSMRRDLDIDFNFKRRKAELNGGYFPRLPHREQTAYDECRNALQMLVEDRKVVCEWIKGRVTYRLDELLMLRMKASCV